MTILDLPSENERLVASGIWVEGFSCPVCGDEDPLRRYVLVDRTPEEAQKAGHARKRLWILACCFTVRNNRVVSKEDLCANCQEVEDWCSCSTCGYSGHKTDETICGECDACEDHCDCIRCPHCSEIAEELCDNCGDCVAGCCMCIECVACETRVSATTTVDGCNEYCDSCLNYAYYCDECEEWYSEDYSSDHEHEEHCGCEAPRQTFEFPAKGVQLLNTVPQDKRITVELPKGTIDKEGIRRIVDLVRQPYNGRYPQYFEVYKAVEEVGPEWQGKRGNFTKRLSAALHKRGMKLEPHIVSHVGNLARQHSSEASEWHIEFTRDLNQDASYFWHDGSCWWGSYGTSRCCLKNWGGIGMRSFRERSGQNYSPSGRVWIQPLNEDMEPTHDALRARAYVTYNGYGDLEGYVAARIVAHLTGLTYRKITFYADEQYVNDDVGYLIADMDTCEDEDNHSIHLAYDPHYQFDARKPLNLARSLV